MKELNSSILHKIDLSQLNLDKDPSKEFALLANYGKNLNPTIFHERIKNDWNVPTLEDLSEYFLGIYQIPNYKLRFNKAGSNGTAYGNLTFLNNNAAYASVFAVPKTLLFNPSSALNKAEGVIDTHNAENPNNHYWLRQFSVSLKPYASETLKIDTFPSIEGKKTINGNSVWYYSATRIAPENFRPEEKYINNILRGLFINGQLVVPQSYHDYIASFL
jgi:hypothetical protein